MARSGLAIDHRSRVLGRSEAHLRILGIVVRVVPLEERVAVDEVEALSRVAADVRHDEVVPVGGPSDLCVARPRPQLSVGNESEVLLQCIP